MEAEKRIVTLDGIRMFIGYTDREFRDILFAEARTESMRQRLLRQASSTKKNKGSAKSKIQRSRESA